MRISAPASQGTRGWIPFAALVLACLTTTARAQDLDVPYFPTPQPAVEKMLEMAGLTGDDILIDLGSGDGRIPITAAKLYGARALGVDLDAARVQQANENAKQERLTNKVTFREQDLFETDLGEATVITMFLLGSVNLKLKPRLQALKPGTRILSYGWSMGDWEPVRSELVDGKPIYMWVVGVTAKRATPAP
ncbi:class I SAM-dependent methyltransferase [Hyphomicrobium sp. CS1GBMeth3]|uniref:SAM-dependent methyltransferase n=1 Tax=Hyphomicrobium sp. CS1GBMeth3 TaxID=1892845 RepID=UPI0009319CAF|nr:class I SAM-dependent methyltransferase [Hyphomicrobium sp. CS1GBMeth3]